MKKEVVSFVYKGKKVELEVRRVPFWYEGIGLMFTSKKNARALLFRYRKPIKMSIFSKFIPYDFFAIWLDGEGEVIEVRRVFRGEKGILPSRKFNKLVEIPITENYDAVCKMLVGKERFK